MSKQNKIILAVIAVFALAGMIYLSKNIKLGGGAGVLKPIEASDHLLGRLDAPVQLIIYSDFECPFCAEFASNIKKAEENFKDKATIAFRHYPLPGHKQAVPAAIASECAAEQGKFWEMHDRLFADNKAGRLSRDQYKQNAKELGLAEEKFNQCLDSDKYEGKIYEQKNAGDDAGVTGTPTVFINGKIYVGAYPFEDFTAPNGDKEDGLKTIISKLLDSKQ